MCLQTAQMQIRCTGHSALPRAQTVHGARRTRPTSSMIVSGFPKKSLLVRYKTGSKRLLGGEGRLCRHAPRGRTSWSMSIVGSLSFKTLVRLWVLIDTTAIHMNTGISKQTMDSHPNPRSSLSLCGNPNGQETRGRCKDNNCNFIFCQQSSAWR